MGAFLPLERYVSLIFAGQYERAGVPHPMLEPAAYVSIARRAYALHSLTHEDDPERLLSAEGVHLCWRPGFSCGARFGDAVFAAWRAEPCQRCLVLHHERGHILTHRFGYDDANEADHWLLTAELALPGPARADYRRALATRRLPAWFVALAVEVPAA